MREVPGCFEKDPADSPIHPGTMRNTSSKRSSARSRFSLVYLCGLTDYSVRMSEKSKPRRIVSPELVDVERVRVEETVCCSEGHRSVCASRIISQKSIRIIRRRKVGKCQPSLRVASSTHPDHFRSAHRPDRDFHLWQGGLKRKKHQLKGFSFRYPRELVGYDRQDLNLSVLGIDAIPPQEIIV